MIATFLKGFAGAQAEEATFRQGRLRALDGDAVAPSWNYQEFRVRYPSLDSELQLEGIFIRLLIDGTDEVWSP
jgi:DNAJ protein RME-8 N-terminal